MIPAHLTDDERRGMLKLARQALEAAVTARALPSQDIEDLPERLKEIGASFVTLTNHGDLRGCIGTIEAHQALADDIREHAAAAALMDYRFNPVTPDELSDIEIEVSYLTPPQPLEYIYPTDLPTLLRPNVDGVVIKDGRRRATFLPQVWEKLPEPEDFLSQLCMKMGAQPDLWLRKKLEILIYQVEEVHEHQFRTS